MVWCAFGLMFKVSARGMDPFGVWSLRRGDGKVGRFLEDARPLSGAEGTTLQ